MAGELGKFSFGVGDRFGMEGTAQLKSILKMEELGVSITPVWNKSNREHQTVNTQPGSVKIEADHAVKELNFKHAYFVDADHINLDTVDAYIAESDFFTIDVAQFIGEKAEKHEKKDFLDFFEKYTTGFHIPGIDRRIEIRDTELHKMTNSFLFAMKKAGEIYFHIKSRKKGEFYTEVSIDEVPTPQSPVELFFILAALGFYQVPVKTIAPKFTGRFNKGVDYRGDLKQFEKEFEEDILVIKYAIKEFKLPEDLKLSVHSGSDKFAIYPVMNRLIKKHQVGLHVKTAGTTWLEEIIGLAESEGDGFNFCIKLYREALECYEEITREYASVLSIDKSKLPAPEDFCNGKKYAGALRHDRNSTDYNPHFRQVLHCAYKIAAEKGNSFFPLLERYRERIENNVTNNLYEKHLKPLFL